jgi:hypothetical protein
MKALRQEFSGRGLFSDAHQAMIGRIQREKDCLAARLSGAERAPRCLGLLELRRWMLRAQRNGNPSIGLVQTIRN